LVKNFVVHIPTRNEWETVKLLQHPRADIWYTDGSGANGRFGAGFYWQKTDQREIIPMGKLAAIFQVEVLAILKCVKVSNNTKNRNIYIYSDSRAAIDALVKITTESSVVWDCIQALNKLGETNKITIVWIPGHQKLHGNLHTFIQPQAGRAKRMPTGEEEEDNIHILYHCPLLALKRYRTWGQMFTKPKDLNKTRISNLCSLVEKTGLDQ